MSQVVSSNHAKVVRHVLIIEDSPMLLKHLSQSIDKLLNLRCDRASTEADAAQMIKRKRYDLVIADIFLPDSTQDFIPKLIRNHQPIVLITGRDEDETRAKLTSLPIVDYVVKHEADNLVQTLIKIIGRYSKNHQTIVGVCDDSTVIRRSIAQILETQNLSYIEFTNGHEVMEYLATDNGKMDLLLTDYEMPVMDGLEMVRKIRETYSSHDLPIISLSASNTAHLVSKFLKAGANDYIHKPYEKEEFLTRLNLMLDMIYTRQERDDLLQKLKDASMTDFLTGLYNRHYFYTNIEHVVAKAQRDKMPYGFLMLDIDHFKKVNDTFGHDAGDAAIRHLAVVIKESIRKGDYAFRWGGEEFVILLTAISDGYLATVCEKIRQAVEANAVEFSDTVMFNITVSIGAISTLSNDYQKMLNEADGFLYRAKKEGRNRVVLSEMDIS